MSFLLRRHLPWAWAGWYDDFSRPPENPVQQPWKHWGDGPLGYINSNQELILPSNYNSVAGGGESYEFQPFTKNFGAEFDLRLPIDGAAAQYFNIFVVENWAKIGVNYAQILCIRLRHRINEVGGDDIGILEFDSYVTEGRRLVTASVPPFIANDIKVRIYIDNDMLVRVYVNDVFTLQAQPQASHRSGPGRRGLNIFNGTLANAHIRLVRLFDRPTDLGYGVRWNNTVFADDFNRPDGPVGNGWTQHGADAALVSGYWAHISGNDNSVGLIRDTGITHGAQKIEATIGAPHADRDSSLVLRTNAGGTEGISANFYSGGIYLARFTGSLQNPTFADYTSVGMNVAAGSKVSLATNGEGAWVTVNGEIVLMAHMNGLVPGANSYAGLRVERSGFADSAAWNDVKILSPF
ncbi:hypothetical protein GV794_01845 [Nocardia cyriacigeorgica]|uniref:DUF1080 domain-containing protein n=1 Tax=Nocardia cyriacigeorgica TaxID=135487 RepID=A0ABX0CCX3_9NOCA|nr:hypothetical protein [Nocardia cyriacigeorgica]NEW40767.1 hypothetical protein [Nocardia cyriacigeorgica]NEW51006.1 hypothetical protein [Nocardia cyriacigeorgica]NEW54410.1 hypothetical protein [Nocardia cyriacigeorgica]